MKAKNILAVRDRLNTLTDSANFHDDDSNSLEFRFDAWEELVYLNYYDSERSQEIRLSLREAKKLKQLLNRLV